MLRIVSAITETSHAGFGNRRAEPQNWFASNDVCTSVDQRNWVVAFSPENAKVIRRVTGAGLCPAINRLPSVQVFV
ncbi:hypothetical protein [Ruficoccus sp. ZRK36]|uniref:hypothetical protein n=1 Tax=Ruficoccus sp. ZRK36 TaxID=2866311 RepID=UPI001C72F29E|nr:hypothetical protein [Ruficoccus sp. ZRK36]QYY36852.1 hypothetical protein K0V07_05085 [Ruficoccus sp. ZRK36]